MYTSISFQTMHKHVLFPGLAGSPSWAEAWRSHGRLSLSTKYADHSDPYSDYNTLRSMGERCQREAGLGLDVTFLSFDQSNVVPGRSELQGTSACLAQVCIVCCVCWVCAGCAVCVVCAVCAVGAVCSVCAVCVLCVLCVLAPTNTSTCLSYRRHFGSMVVALATVAKSSLRPPASGH